MVFRSALIAFPAGTGGEWLVDPITVGVREGDALLIGAHMQSECAREGGREGGTREMQTGTIPPGPIG